MTLWGRRWSATEELTISVYGSEGVYAIGTAVAEPSLARAAEGADIALIAVPVDARRRVMEEAADALNECALLVAWEGMGWFREHLQELGLKRPLAVGLQRSPILCRVRSIGRAVEVFGTRSEVVAAPTEPAHRVRAKRFLSAVLPFRVAIAPSYVCVSLSPSNPLIHPARLYSSGRQGFDLARGTRFYADWDDAASEILLALHADVALLRDALRLPKIYLRTLADQRDVRPAAITKLHRGLVGAMAELQLPVHRDARGATLDREHRFFREDIGEGLGYMLHLAGEAGVVMPTAQAVFRWYEEGAAHGKGRSSAEGQDAPSRGLR